MTIKKNLLRAVKKALGNKDTKTTPAVLGNYAGVVSTGKPFEVYARVMSGDVIKVINQIAPNRFDLKVTLGKTTSQRQWQVIGVRDAYQDLAAPNVPEHNSQHRYLPIYRDQIIPLLLFPISGTLTVQLFGSVVVCNGVFATVDSQVIDLTDSQPENGARWVLIGYDETGSVTTLDGDVIVNKEILTINDVPNVEYGNYPIAAVRIYTGQTEFAYMDDFLYPFTAGEGANVPIFNDAEGLPANVSHTAPAYGTSQYPARRDHVHFSDNGTRYRQFVYVVSDGDFSFVIDETGNPVMSLEDLE